MSLKLNPSPTYFAPASLRMLSEDGELQTHLFDARFKRLKPAEVKELVEGIEKGDVNDEALLDQVLVGWRGVQDAAGVAMPFTAENLAEVCAGLLGMRQALVHAYIASTSPTASAHLLEKNS